MSFGGGSTSQQPVLTFSQRELLKDLTAKLRQELGQPGEVFPGELVPGPSPLQEQAFRMAGQIEAPATAGFMRALSGEPAYEIDPAARERAYNAIEAQTMAQFQKQLPYLEERYNAMGAGRSGGLQHAMASAAGDVSLGLGAMRGQYEYQDEMARRAAMESAAARQFEASAGGLEGLSGLGGIQRSILGQQTGEAYNKWLMAQPYANPWLGFFPQALGTQATAPAYSSWQFGLV